MHAVFVFAPLLLVSSTLAYQVTYPNSTDGWSASGSNNLVWTHVDTDRLTFAVVLVNSDFSVNVTLSSTVDGTLGSTTLQQPSTGWPTGSNFHVDLAQDASHVDSLLAQSSTFSITTVSSNQSTSSPASTQTGTSTATPSVSSSDTSTTPAGTSAASLSADTRAGLLSAITALMALVTALF